MGELILTRAKDLFFTYGLKSVSMDDLAKGAGISKKTIYQSFEDKNALVNKVVDELTQCHQQLLKTCSKEAADAVDEVLKQANIPFRIWSNATPGFFYELERFFPQAWKKVEQHKEKVLHPTITKNIARGKDEGLFREELDDVFITDIRIQQLSNALQPAAFSRNTLGVNGLINELTIFYLHAITTEKGKKILYKYLKNNNENRRTN